jgi:hypothetical protein
VLNLAAFTFILFTKLTINCSFAFQGDTKQIMKFQSVFRVFAVICQLIMYVVYVESSVFISDVKMEKMIELTAKKPHCRLHTDRGFIQSTLLNSDQMKIRQVPVESVAALENVCFKGKQLSGELQGKQLVLVFNAFNRIKLFCYRWNEFCKQTLKLITIFII